MSLGQRSPPTVVDAVESASWSDAVPEATVVVSTWNRAAMLEDLLTALEAQTAAPTRFELVVVDNGSVDRTFESLRDVADRTSLPMCALRIAENAGPGPARDAGAARGRAPILLITDDDCIPDPSWVEAMLDAFGRSDAPLIQGLVRPPATELASARPWDHTMYVLGLSPFFQTCNIGYRTAEFWQVGGFTTEDPLVSGADGRAFGEDTVLGSAVVALGGDPVFAPEAVVHHRVVPSTWRSQLRDRRHAVGIPGLAQRCPAMRESLVWGVFVSRATRRFDVAVAGVATGALTRSPLPLVAVLPWARFRWRSTRRARTPGGRVVAMVGWFVLDGLVACSLVEGSVRHRRLVV